MKIRTDFVTNSSSSSFVVYSIDNPSLARILKKYDICRVNGTTISGVFENDGGISEEAAERDASVGGYRSNLVYWLEDCVLADMTNWDYPKKNQLFAELEANQEKINKDTRDYEVDYRHVVTDDVGCYYEYDRKADDTIVSASFSEWDIDWDYQKEGIAFHSVVQEYTTDALNEIAKVKGSYSKHIVLSDGTQYDASQEKDGFTKKHAEIKTKALAAEKAARARLHPLEFAGKTFITTGLSVQEEETVVKTVESRGGLFKDRFVKSIDCLIYNPNYGHETQKMKQVKELKESGKDVNIITYESFLDYV